MISDKYEKLLNFVKSNFKNTETEKKYMTLLPLYYLS